MGVNFLRTQKSGDKKTTSLETNYHYYFRTGWSTEFADGLREKHLKRRPVKPHSAMLSVIKMYFEISRRS